MSCICDAKGSLKEIFKTKCSIVVELNLGSIMLEFSNRTGYVSYRQLHRLIGKEVSIAFEFEAGHSIPKLLGVRELVGTRQSFFDHARIQRVGEDRGGLRYEQRRRGCEATGKVNPEPRILVRSERY